MNNLINFPTVNCVTLKQSKERHNIISEQSKKYNLNLNFCYAYDGVNNSLSELAEVSSPFLSEMNCGEICAVISHLKAIQEWYFNTDEAYGFFCEDDVLLSLNESWNFTWNDFINQLPYNWGIVQLSLIRNFELEAPDRFMKFNQYLWDNWSACAYIVSRRYAKQLIDYHYKGENVYDLNLPYYPNTIPFIENVLYNADNKETAYTIPLFVENTEITSSFYPKFIDSNLKDNQKYSSYAIQKWWQDNGKLIPINYFFSEKENQRSINSLSVNLEYKKSKRLFVVDNFYHNPDAVREFALHQEYFDDPGYIGRRTREQFFLPGIKEAFEEIMGEKITKWEEYGMNARFQHNWAGEKLVYHCDEQKWAGMIYLTPDAPPECGTTMWRHKKTKIHHNTQINWAEGQGTQVFNQRTFLDKTPYEPVDVCGNIYNRLVIFSGGCIHSASEYFGDCLENCRLWHMFFFDAEPT